MSISNGMRRWTARLALVIVAVTVAAVTVAETPYRDIDAGTLQTLIDRGVKVVDVRTPEEWRSTGVIEGSRRIMAFDPQGRFDPAFPDALRAFAGPDEEVALICWSGGRSRVLAEALTRQAGYTRVYNATGGMIEWLGDGRPVDACASC